MMLEMLRWRQADRKWPEFPTRLASIGFAAAVGVAVLTGMEDIGLVETWLVLGALGMLYLAAVLWFAGARALGDLAPLPVLAALWMLFVQGLANGTLKAAFSALREPESSSPLTVTILIAAALAGSALAFWRSRKGEEFVIAWASGAALLAPLTLVVLELSWSPSRVLGAYPWALHALAIAVAMTLFATQSGRADSPDKARAAIFTMAALSMISFALITVLTDVALTLALAVTVLLAAVIDRWQNMRLLPLFVQVGVVVIGLRLTAYPGLFWAQDAALWQVWLAYGGTILLFLAAWLILSGMERPAAQIMLESAIWVLGAVFVAVLLYRLFGRDLNSHWGMALVGSVWLVSMAGQLYRIKAEGPLNWVRMVLAMLFGLGGIVAMRLVVTEFNPLIFPAEIVLGPPVLDTLLVAFVLPAACLAFVAFRFEHLHQYLRIGAGGFAALLGVAYVGLEIRRSWRGDVLAVPGTTGPELYSYTVAMLIGAVAGLFLAFARRSVLLRQIAMAGVALTIAKVFLLDMSGLSGLTRVASFLGLGLSLTGLAWINRRMTEQWDGAQPGSDISPD
jgi:uncharacterized membrane protein